MAKKVAKKKTVGSFLTSISHSLIEDKPKGIPNIIEFVESDEYLGFLSGPRPINLYPSQRLMLKVFYRGTVGNEDLKLTEEEVETIKNLGLTSPERGNVFGKYYSNEVFNELVLIWGRRSGKDFVSSIIALYEALKLLEVPGGDPYSYYNTAPGEPITLLTIANSNPQAQIAFNMIREKCRNSKYFQGKYLPEGFESQKIHLLTPLDRENNIKYKARGESITKGSIVIEVGHSNSDSLIGKGCFLLILDEVASYPTGTSGSGSGERIYAALSPTINTYFRRIPQIDSDGKPIINPDGKQAEQIIYDGKKITISTPRGKEGKLWELYDRDSQAPKQLMCKLPTWQVNPYQTRKALRESNMSMSDTEFMMEFGAEFAGVAGENMFDRDAVMDSMKYSIAHREVGQPGRLYFAHLDPASSSHNYALIVVHMETEINRETRKSETFIIVDHIKYWSPIAGQLLNIEEIDEYVINLKKRFHLGMVTYDVWNSTASINKMKKAGIPAKQTPYSRNYKTKIYTELEQLFNARSIKIPNHELMKNELLELQRRFADNGFKVYPRRDGDGCKTDDLVDALAGAVYSAITARINSLPKGKLINTGIVPQSNSRMWQGMSGPIGFGPGHAVANKLDKIDSWPNRRR